MMHPKPALREKKPPKPLRRTRVVTRRKKARPGRLRGEDIERLRHECFVRDGFCCSDCGHGITWESGHMAHVKAKRIGLDLLSNVRTKCARCHGIEHAYGPTGLKPCKAKERAQ